MQTSANLTHIHVDNIHTDITPAHKNHLTTDNKILPPELCPYEHPTDKPRHTYLCEDSPEGILSAIYEAWSSRYGHAYNYIQVDTGYNYQLFSEYIHVKTDINKATSVASSIKHRISYDFYDLVKSCLLSYNTERADDIYRLIILGFTVGNSARYYLSYPFVQRILKLERNIENERHHYLGFIRFEELEDLSLFAKFRPKNDVLTLISPHFADRFPEERLIIADVERNNIAFIHYGHIEYAVANDIDLASFQPGNSENELMLKQLWQTFVTSIEIKERHNPSLRRQNMPLRFREFATEFL